MKMKKTILQKLQDIMWATDWTQHDLAERLNTTQPSVSRWFTGSDPRGAMRDAIDDLYKQVIDANGIGANESAVPLMGRIGAGSEISPEFEQVPVDGLEQILVPFPLPDEMIAFQVYGDSMLPAYKDGTIVIVYKNQKKPLEAFYGHDAAVRTADGRRFLKTIMRGSNGVNLLSWNAGPIESVELVWIGEIFATLPSQSIHKMMHT